MRESCVWDHTGNPLKRTEYWSGTGAYNTTLRYDDVYRLTQELLKDPSQSTVYSLAYGYDAVGNRTSMTRDSTSYSYTCDDNDKLTAVSGGGQSASLSYDSNGNMTGVSGALFGSWTLVFDDENRLTSLTYPSGGGSATNSYYYNALGQRMKARLPGYGCPIYVYDGDRVVEEWCWQGTGVWSRHTTAGGSFADMWLGMARSGGNRYPLLDGIGTVRGLVLDSGATDSTYDFDAFGVPLGSTGSTPNYYRYGGAWGYITDPSGMLQLGARYYWPEIGRFISQDPIGEGNNWYIYGAANPLVNIDPDGQVVWMTVVAVVLIVAIVAEMVICALQGHEQEPHVNPTVPYVPPPPPVPVGR